MSLPSSPEQYYAKLRVILQQAPTREHLLDAIVNAPFHEMRRAMHVDLGIIVLLLTNPEEGTIDRIALSNTEAAQGAVKMSEKPFHEIKIPLNHRTNAIAKAIATGQPQAVSDWKYLFVPALSTQAARFNQAGSGIECSCVHPFDDGRHGGALIFSFFQPHGNIGPQHLEFMDTYTALVAEALRGQAVSHRA